MMVNGLPKYCVHRRDTIELRVGVYVYSILLLLTVALSIITITVPFIGGAEAVNSTVVQVMLVAWTLAQL